jgi:hypothetical protein
MRAVPRTTSERGNKGGHVRAVALLCSPDARPEKGLVQARDWTPISPYPPRTELARADLSAVSR